MPNGLPTSGPISSSQVEVYVFDRTSTQEFSLSASLAGTTVDKGYPTNLGPLWRGTGASDIDNQQYNQGANNFSLSDWYTYTKGFLVNGSEQFNSPDDACIDMAEAIAYYITDGQYWGTTAGAFISNDNTKGYSNTSGTTLAANTRYRKIYEMYAAYQINDGNGIFVNEYPCGF